METWFSMVHYVDTQGCGLNIRANFVYLTSGHQKNQSILPQIRLIPSENCGIRGCHQPQCQLQLPGSVRLNRGDLQKKISCPPTFSWVQSYFQYQATYFSTGFFNWKTMQKRERTSMLRDQLRVKTPFQKIQNILLVWEDILLSTVIQKWRCHWL